MANNQRDRWKNGGAIIMPTILTNGGICKTELPLYPKRPQKGKRGRKRRTMTTHFIRYFLINFLINSLLF